MTDRDDDATKGRVEALEAQVRELQASEARLRALLDSALDTVVMFDLEGRYLYINPAGAWEGPPETLLGTSVFDADRPGIPEAVRFAMDELLAGSGPIRRELTLERDGRMVELEARATLIRDESGAPIGFSAILRDITDRRDAERAQREAEQLREVDALRNTFLSNISHELRTPLVSMLGYAELLLRHDQPPAEWRGWLEVVLRSGRRLEGIVDGLLDIARLHTGSLPLSPEPTDLAELIRACAMLVRPLADRKDLLLEEELPSGPLVAAVDRQRISSVLLNLLDNAIKFSPAGETITVSLEETDGAVQVCVRDHGPGVPSHLHERVFERFFRVHRHSRGGSGIGLALVKEIVAAHGGAAWLHSEPEAGAAFYFQVPVKGPLEVPAAVEEEAGGTGQRAPVRSLDVLVVDDDVEVRDVLDAMLRQERCRPWLAADGAEALAQLAQREVDLVLVDMAMPGIDGAEVCRRIRADDAFRDLPVYVISAFASDATRQEALAAGANGFLAKPFSLGELGELLEAVGTGPR